jgi:hypothetical protein
MTGHGGEIVVQAQWALYGKATGTSGDRVLACSTGDLAMVNFADAISRFQLGALPALPQVSVSYARPVKSGRSYLALAIHKPADHAPTDHGPANHGQVARDADGRPVTYTNYFCLPYGPLAASGVTYRAMHEALGGLRLPTANGAPLRVSIPGRPWQPPVTDLLALRVAALLLTGRSVCVLKAQQIPVDDRLGFIDTVMALLPYGFRAKMTAATWTRATYRDHRFRLFFSDAPRGEERPDHVVSWGRPETAVVTPTDGAAYEYLTWLEETLIEPMARLNRLTGTYGFGDGSIRNAVSLVTGGSVVDGGAVDGGAVDSADGGVGDVLRETETAADTAADPAPPVLPEP